ncbi:MAG: PIN domain-containing protein [Acidobacteria bacterium]|nr:PIN domain-containing protein [Acidobacteriota bacterium]
MYLVDTNILSTGAPGPRERPVAWERWMDAHSDELFLSAVTVAEVCEGIAKLKRTGADLRARRLADWLEAVVHLYGDRILPFGLREARLAGMIMDRVRGTGGSPGFADLAIAATAASRDLTILTRNVRHFAPLGARVVNPFEMVPG